MLSMMPMILMPKMLDDCDGGGGGVYADAVVDDQIDDQADEADDDYALFAMQATGKPHPSATAEDENVQKCRWHKAKAFCDTRRGTDQRTCHDLHEYWNPLVPHGVVLCLGLDAGVHSMPTGIGQSHELCTTHGLD